MSKYKFIMLLLLQLILLSLLADENQIVKRDTTFIDSLKTAKITFIELGSVKCIPCKMMQPVMKEIEEEFSDTVEVLFYDVWTKDGKKYGQEYKVKIIPTQVFLDEKGNEFFRHEGFFSKEEIAELINKQLKK
jgi:thioredoxin